MKTPNFFVIGAPKCGTTSLASYLAEHPRVFMTSPKEPHHFSSDIDHGNYKNREEYRNLFRKASPAHDAIGEASVWYLFSTQAVKNIEHEFPKAKYIVMLRNPVEMAPSLHQQKVFSGHEDILSFDLAWHAQIKRKAGEQIPRFVTDPALLLYKDACCLGSQLERLYSLVDRERVLVLFLDDLKNDPREVWLTVQSFLEVEDDGRTEFRVLNVAKRRKSLTLKKMNDYYGTFRRRFGIKPMGTGFFTRINEWNFRERKREPLGEDIKNNLQKEFECEIVKLEKLTGRCLSHWRH